MQIQFLGAADTVTGSRHLVTVGDQRILLDCGLFQGYKVLRERNWAPLAVPPHEIDAVVLSHAHLDHSGWLPGLVKAGFRGPIHASPATCDLAQVLLLDSAHLQEEDARRANRYGFSRHEKALPLYNRADAKKAIAKLVPMAPGRARMVGHASVTLTPVGHLLGACSVSLTHGGQTLAFSGDVGRSADWLMPPPQPLPAADVLLVESTYGNRRHPDARETPAELARIIRNTVARGGKVLMPSFAVGRAQALLLVLQRLKRAGEIPAQLPIYLDSPMAIEATALYTHHRRLLRVPQREIAQLCDGVRMVTTAALSMRLAASRAPAVIISASGMATGGRVLHHLKLMAPDERHHIVFAGFQVGGSRGAHLVAGAREVKIHGEYVPVRAPVSALEGFSGHADGDELLDWLRRMPGAPSQTFVVHGEPDAADTLRLRIKDGLGWKVRVPQHGEVVRL
ncbi:MAG: MBL fold metallo-hydrolase [Aquabacterium sp.]|nr:MBL fold metallo-hydrolase [Aquabacterium sp.]